MTALEQPVTALKGVGKARAADLRKLNIETVEDMLYHFPFRYEDRANVKPVDQLRPGQLETVRGRVLQVRLAYLSGRRQVVRARLAAEGGGLTLVWFNQPYVAQRLAEGMDIIASGRYSADYGKQLAVQDYDILGPEDDGADFMRITPIYRCTEKTNVKFVRKLVAQALDEHLPQVVDYLPEDLRAQYRLMPLAEAIRELHLPTAWERLNLARYRLVMDEFLVLLLGLRQKTLLADRQGIQHAAAEGLTDRFIRSLPFALTNGQKKVILEIKRDMESPRPMQRLLQGDVGCGKTMVAVYALLKAAEGGWQGAMMAPTEILAEQHYRNLRGLLAPLGVEVALLKSAMGKKEKDAVLAAVADGTAQVVVGTHALIQQTVQFQRLGVAVVDEQHRFGVRQQLSLERKGQQPDVLVMTATPIPRSLALTIYGDMDLSVIDELPPGRQQILTWHISERKRQDMYGFVARELAQGHQAYVVCPLVQESEKLDLENAVALAERLSREVFPQFAVGLLHGQMSAEDKAAVMERFRLGELRLLVATTVIEVGVDVPNANVMIIENADRFGLAQLHQLRGRVGRGTEQAYCILLSEAKTEEGRRRMAIMTASTDGFVIAEEDLAMRGPGEALGTRQHGLPDLRIADLVHDVKILEQSKVLAEDILSQGLGQEKFAPLAERIRQIYERKRGEES